MAVHPIADQARNDIGGYFLAMYGGAEGQTLQAANAVSALGALAGVYAQIQARAMLAKGELLGGAPLVEVKTRDGSVFYFGDAINACLLEGNADRLSFWNLAAPAAEDPEIEKHIDVAEIAGHTARVVGGAEFGAPRFATRFGLTEAPLDAVRRHTTVLAQRFHQIALPQDQLMWAFGAAAQGFAPIAAGERADIPVAMPMPRLEIVRLYMESAVPMSKLDVPRLFAAAG